MSSRTLLLFTLFQPVDYSSDEETVSTLTIIYYFFLSKFTDMFDSVFFLARKKFGHLSDLHVIHHCILPWFTWFGVKFAGGGHSMFGVWLNSGVHTIMYFYYFLAASGPQVQKYLWWKKYLTSLQIIQFVVIFLHSLQPIFFVCDYSRIMSVLIIFNCALFCILFSGFYKTTYNNKKDVHKQR